MIPFFTVFLGKTHLKSSHGAQFRLGWIIPEVFVDVHPPFGRIGNSHDHDLPNRI